MNYCIRCNPRSELVTDEAGELECRYHDKQYLLEVVESAPAEVPAEEAPQ